MKSKKHYEEVAVDMNDRTFLEIAREAHSHDITFNEMCCRILKKRITEAQMQKSAGRK